MKAESPTNLFTVYTATQSRLDTLTRERIAAEEEAASLKVTLELVTARVSDLSAEAKVIEEEVAALKKQLDARQREWVKLTGDKYPAAEVELGATARAVLEQFKSWTPERAKASPELSEVGVRFDGPRSQVDHIVGELGRRLFLDGYDVFPASGSAFAERQGDGAFTARLMQCEILILLGPDEISNKHHAQELRAALQGRKDRGLPTLASTSKWLSSLDPGADILREATAALPPSTVNIPNSAPLAKAA